MKTTFKTLCLLAFLIGTTTIIGCKKKDATPEALAGNIVSFSDPLLSSAMPANVTTFVLNTNTVATPTKAGYTFVGWSQTSTLYAPTISFPYTVTTNTTLYPQWVSTISKSDTKTSNGTVTINSVNKLSTEIVIIPARFNDLPVESIDGYEILEDNTSIKTVYLPQGLAVIGVGAFYRCISLSTINIPNTVTTVTEGSFFQCKGLTTITIPNSTHTIGEGAFSMCAGLTKITIGTGITSLGDQTFFGSSSLKEIIVNATTAPKFELNIFDSTHTALEVKVPAGSVEAYKTALTGKIDDINRIKAQ